MSPYVITTKQPGSDQTDGVFVITPSNETRRAVATLDEARTYCADESRDRLPDVGFPKWMHTVRNSLALPESGGTVGPLPDGTVIEIEQITYSTLTDQIADFNDLPYEQRRTNAQAIDAYNANEGKDATNDTPSLR